MGEEGVRLCACGKPTRAGRTLCTSCQCHKWRNSNPEKVKEYRSKYNEDNREKRLEYGRNYYQDNPEKIRAQSRKYYDANSEKIKAKRRESYTANPEKYREMRRKYLNVHREEIREKKRTDYAANPEKYRAYSRKYREKNLEQERGKCRKWHEANPEKSREGRRKWYEANKEKVLEYNRTRRQANPEENREHCHRRAATRASLRWLARLITTSDQLKEESMSKATDLQEKMTPAFEAICNGMNIMSDEQLKSAMSGNLLDSAKSLEKAAAALKILEDRGVKVSGDKYLFMILRKISSGKWSPSAVVRFNGEQFIQQKILSLPRAQQDELLKKPDDEVRKEVQEKIDAEKQKVGEKKIVTRHVITVAEHDALKQENALLKVENEQLRLRVAGLEKALDAISPGKKRKRSA